MKEVNFKDKTVITCNTLGLMFFRIKEKKKTMRNIFLDLGFKHMC